MNITNFFHLGRMMSPSKSGYCKQYPDGHPVFNANICTSQGKKIWYGDIDLIRDADKLKQLAADLGEGFYVLREMDGRFQNEDRPLIENAVAKVTDTAVTITPSQY